MNLEHTVESEKIEPATLRKIKGMLGIGETQAVALKREIAAAQGRIFILVHPFYFHENDTSDRDSSLQKTPQAERTIARTEKFIQSSSTRKPPLLVFQEQSHLQEREKLLTKIGAEKVYLMPTHPDTPHPDFTVVDENGSARVGTWDDIRDVLSGLGVTRVLIGGTYLWDSAPALGGVFRAVRNTLQSSRGGYDGCVGHTRKQLETVFPVEISSFSYPISRKDFRNAKDR